MAKVIVIGEQPVQINAHAFSVSPSDEGYTFAYSADGENYTNYSEAVPAGETLIVNGIAYGQFVKFVGNNTELTVRY